MFKRKKIILHLCADIGSDSYYYQIDPAYEVIKVGIEIGVENYTPPSRVHGIIANPKCDQFSIATGFDTVGDIEGGMIMVNHCLRIIMEADPEWFALENPKTGRLKEKLGPPMHWYEPWHYGSPWTKATALWGSFVMPPRRFTRWDDVPKNKNLYVRPGRPKPSLAFLHKSALKYLPEYAWAAEFIKCDADLRSLCSDGFAHDFYIHNP